MFPNSLFQGTACDIVYENRIMPLGGLNGNNVTTSSPIITRFNSRYVKLECHLSRDVSIVGNYRPTHDNELREEGWDNFNMGMVR